MKALWQLAHLLAWAFAIGVAVCAVVLVVFLG